MSLSPFDFTVKALRKAGYPVKIRSLPYRFATFETKGVRGGFCEPNGSSYWYIDGKVAADNKLCFNKWSQCPLCIPLPTDTLKTNELLSYLKWLATEEARQWSSSFEYVSNPKLPRLMCRISIN